MITRYIYDKSFVYLSEIEIKDEFQTFPINSTETAPPIPSSGEFAVFNGAEWAIVTEKPTIHKAIPDIVPMSKARLAIFKSGLTDAVTSAIDALPEPPKTEVLIEWEYSTKVTRANPLVVLLTNNIGLTKQEIDDLFILADSLRD